MNPKKDTIQLVIANFIQLLFGLFQVVFFSRLLQEKHDFGLLQQITLISSLLIASAGTLPNAINYFFGLYAPTAADTGRLIKRFFYSTCMLAALTGLLLFLLKAPLAAIFSNPLLQEQAVWVTFLVFLRLTNVIYQNICLIRRKLRQLILVHFLQVLLLCTAFLFRDETGHISVTTLLYILVCAELIKTLPMLILIGPDFLSNDTALRDVRLTSQEWKYVLFVLMNGILIAVSSQSDRLIVASFSSPETYSDYSLGTFANPALGVLLASLTSTFIPALSSLYARNDVTGILNLWKKTSGTGMVLILPLILFTVFFGDDVILFLFSSKYASAAPLFQLFNIKFLLIFIVFTVTMNATGLERYTVINSAINLTTSVCLVIAGLKLYGAAGAITGSVISIYLGYFFPVFVVNRKFRCSLSDYFPVKSFFITLAFCCSAGILLLIMKKIFLFSPFIIIFIAGPLYYVSCFILLNKFVLKIVGISELGKKLFSK